MTLTNRDKRILMVFPAAVMLVGYVLWFSLSGKYTALAQARTSLEKAGKAAPTDDLARIRQIDLALRNSEVARKSKEALEAKARLLRQLVCVDPDCRAARLQQLTSLLTRHGLTVIEHGFAETSKDRLSQTADALRKRLPNSATLQLHKIRFVARYEDVAHATQALAAEGAMAIPVSLTMKESRDFSVWHEWVMLVWV